MPAKRFTSIPYFEEGKIGEGIALILLGLMGMLPFLQWKHYYPLTDFYTEWVAALLGFCALLSAFRILHEIPRIAFVPLLLIVLVWLQYALGMIGYIQHAALVSLYLLWGALLAMLGYALKREIGLQKIIPVLAWFILAGGVLSGIAAVMQHYLIPSFIDHFITPDPSPTVFGNLAQQNHFSDYMALSIASLLYLASSKRINPIVALPIGLFMLFTLALSGSRSAWLYLGAMTMLGLLFCRGNRTLLYGSLMLLPAFLVMQLAPHLHFISGHGAVTSGQRLVEKDSGIRLYLWHEAWMMFLKAPILGVGFGEFAWHHFEYGPLFNNSRISGLYNNSHDIVMNLLAETGISGCLIVFGGILLWARRIDISRDSHAFWLFSLLSVLALHSLDEYPLWYAQFLGLFMLLMGLTESSAFRIPFQKGIVAILLVLGSYVLVDLMRDYRVLEGLLFPDYQGGKHQLPPDKLFDRLDHFNRYTLLRPYVEFSLAGMLPINSIDLDKKLELSNRAVHYAPAGMILFRDAAFLALAGKSKEAKLEIERASCASPEDILEAGKLYLTLARSNPRQFMPLVVEVGTQVKLRNIH